MSDEAQRRDDETRRQIHKGIADAFEGAEPGTFLVRWCLMAEVVLPDGTHVLRERTGNAQGDRPASWERLGFYRAGVINATDDLRASTEPGTSD